MMLFATASLWAFALSLLLAAAVVPVSLVWLTLRALLSDKWYAPAFLLGVVPSGAAAVGAVQGVFEVLA